MRKFRQKSVIVEATQIDSESFSYSQRIQGFFYNLRDLTITFHTPNGMVKCRIGDWIVKGPDGGYTRCFAKPFLMAYEEVQ